MRSSDVRKSLQQQDAARLAAAEHNPSSVIYSALRLTNEPRTLEETLVFFKNELATYFRDIPNAETCMAFYMVAVPRLRNVIAVTDRYIGLPEHKWIDAIAEKAGANTHLQLQQKDRTTDENIHVVGLSSAYEYRGRACAILDQFLTSAKGLKFSEPQLFTLSFATQVNARTVIYGNQYASQAENDALIVQSIRPRTAQKQKAAPVKDTATKSAESIATVPPPSGKEKTAKKPPQVSALTEKPLHFDELIARGTKFFREGNLTAGLQDFDEALRRAPDNPKAQFGRIYYHTTRKEASELAKYPDPATIEEQLSNKQKALWNTWKAAQPKPAATTTQKTSSVEENIPLEDLIARGTKFFSENNTKLALRDFDEALRRAPENPRAQFGRIYYHSMQKEAGELAKYPNPATIEAQFSGRQRVLWNTWKATQPQASAIKKEEAGSITPPVQDSTEIWETQKNRKKKEEKPAEAAEVPVSTQPVTPPQKQTAPKHKAPQQERPSLTIASVFDASMQQQQAEKRKRGQQHPKPTNTPRNGKTLAGTAIQPVAQEKTEEKPIVIQDTATIKEADTLLEDSKTLPGTATLSVVPVQAEEKPIVIQGNATAKEVDMQPKSVITSASVSVSPMIGGTSNPQQLQQWPMQQWHMQQQHYYIQQTAAICTRLQQAITSGPLLYPVEQHNFMLLGIGQQQSTYPRRNDISFMMDAYGLITKEHALTPEEHTFFRERIFGLSSQFPISLTNPDFMPTDNEWKKLINLAAPSRRPSPEATQFVTQYIIPVLHAMHDNTRKQILGLRSSEMEIYRQLAPQQPGKAQRF